MNNKKKILIIILILVIISGFITLKNLFKLYVNKIKPYYDLQYKYIGLKNKNLKIKKSINKENQKSKDNEKMLSEIKEKREKLEKIINKYEIKENSKIVYLTFDDGPSIYTDDILNILDKYNIKATFFVTCSSNLEEFSKKLMKKGHTIGLHSCTHNYSYIYSSKEVYFDDLNKLSSIIEKSSGYKSKYVRFPGGSSNTVSKFNKGIMSELSKELTNKGYKYFDWNIDSNDAKGANKEQIYSNVIGSLENNDRNISMILMHDTKVYTKDALEKIIIDALNMGYTFLNISDNTKEVHHYINN